MSERQDAEDEKKAYHSCNLEAKVAVAALKGDKTLAQLAEQFDVHPNQITEWRRQLVGNSDQVFGHSEKQIEESEQKNKGLFP
ncbi:MAG: transposase [Candidatus Sedimenticola sp. (ex Thyasira tokunagai)]